MSAVVVTVHPVADPGQEHGALKKVGSEYEQRWGRVRLLAERRYGELLGPPEPQPRDEIGRVTGGHTEMADRKSRERARAVAAVPEPVFNEYVENEPQPTRAGLLRQAVDALRRLMNNGYEPAAVSIALCPFIHIAEGRAAGRRNSRRQGGPGAPHMPVRPARLRRLAAAVNGPPGVQRAIRCRRAQEWLCATHGLFDWTDPRNLPVLLRHGRRPGDRHPEVRA